MSWISEHKKVWRGAILVLLLVAIMGPWTFELINVPSKYPCSPPFIRLEGDYCGEPMSGIWIFGWMVNVFIYTSAGLISGAMVFIEWVREALISLLSFLLVLPFFSTLLLILRGDRRHRQMLNIAAWGLAAGIGLVWGISSFSSPVWALWGLWLYIGLAASALILEMLTLVEGRRLNQG